MDIVVQYILAGLGWGYVLLGVEWLLSLVLFPLLSLINLNSCGLKAVR